MPKRDHSDPVTLSSPCRICGGCEWVCSEAHDVALRSAPVLTPELVDVLADSCVKAIHQLITDQLAYRLRNAIREAINEAVKQ